MKCLRCGYAAIPVLLLAVSSVLGETAAKSTTGAGAGTFLGMWSVKAMVDQACTNIARRYNLNERQEIYTRALMANRVQQFIQENGGEVERLIADMMKQGADPSNPPPADTVRDWGKRSLPLYEAARRAILDGNKDWREILNDEQKKVHDFDLTQMRQTFQFMEKQFDRWSRDGQYRPGETPFPGLPRLAREANQRGQIGPGTGPVYTEESHWTRWVSQFINDYKLDRAQMTSAIGILGDCKVRAAKHREAHQSEILAAKTRILELKGTTDNKDPEELKKQEARLQELQKPFDDLFKELQERVGRIPTEAQRAAYEEAKKAATAKATAKPAGGPSSQPAPTVGARAAEIK